MKKNLVMITLVAFAILALPLMSAAECNLDVSMINQDPYPAIPGDYVKVVFQIDGIQNVNCGTVSIRVKESFPISLDPNSTNKKTVTSGTYTQSSYSSFFLAPYKLRVSEDAIKGDNPIEIAYSSKDGAEILKEFNLYVEDSHADFEIYVKNYDPLTRTLTFEILNIEDVDVEALTLEIPKQDNITIKGPNKKVIGDLDSNEYTSADFEATINDGLVNINIIYTDSINVRRSITKQVEFDSSYFTDRNGSEKKQPVWLYIVVVLVIAWFIWRQVKKNKAKKKRMMKHSHSPMGKH